MISKCINWLKNRFDLKRKLEAEKSKSKHYAMLYQNALEDSLALSQRCTQLRRRIQELDGPVSAKKNKAPVTA